MVKNPIDDFDDFNDFEEEEDSLASLPKKVQSQIKTIANSMFNTSIGKFYLEDKKRKKDIRLSRNQILQRLNILDNYSQKIEEQRAKTSRVSGSDNALLIALDLVDDQIEEAKHYYNDLFQDSSKQKVSLTSDLKALASTGIYNWQQNLKQSMTSPFRQATEGNGLKSTLINHGLSLLQKKKKKGIVSTGILKVFGVNPDLYSDVKNTKKKKGIYNSYSSTDESNSFERTSKNSRTSKEKPYSNMAPNIDNLVAKTSSSILDLEDSTRIATKTVLDLVNTRFDTLETGLIKGKMRTQDYGLRELYLVSLIKKLGGLKGGEGSAIGDVGETLVEYYFGRKIFKKLGGIKGGITNKLKNLGSKIPGFRKGKEVINRGKDVIGKGKTLLSSSLKKGIASSSKMVLGTSRVRIPSVGKSILGKAGATAVLALSALEAKDAYARGDSEGVGNAVGSGVGSLAGGALGGIAAGMASGAIVGSVVPVVGTAIGALVGTAVGIGGYLIGSEIGSSVGSSIGGTVGKRFGNKSESKPKNQYQRRSKEEYNRYVASIPTTGIYDTNNSNSTSVVASNSSSYSLSSPSPDIRTYKPSVFSDIDLKSNKDCIEQLKLVTAGSLTTLGGGGWNSVAKVNPSLLKKFTLATTEFYEKTGRRLTITSAFRTTKDQQSLQGQGNAARAGRSPHEKGLAIDIGDEHGGGVMGRKNTIADAFAPFAHKYGLWRPMVEGPKKHGREEQHFQQTGNTPTTKSPESKGITESPTNAVARLSPSPNSSGSSTGGSVQPIIPVSTSINTVPSTSTSISPPSPRNTFGARVSPASNTKGDIDIPLYINDPSVQAFKIDPTRPIEG